MRALLIDFGISLLGSIAAWLLTLKLGETLRPKRWRWHALCFLAAFGIIFLGLFIFSRWSLPVSEPRQSKSGAGPKVTSDKSPAASGRTASLKSQLTPEDIFMKNYLAVANAERETNTPRWAVVLKDGNESASSELTSAVFEVLTAKGYRVVPVFRSNIFGDSGYRQLHEANSALLQKLHQICDGIVIGEVIRTLSTEENMQNLVTARISLNLRILRTNADGSISDLPVSARGGGFSEATASAQANNRVAEALKETLSAQLH